MIKVPLRSQKTQDSTTELFTLFVKESYQMKILIKVIYCSSSDMMADIMTKGPITKNKFDKLRTSLKIYAC